MDKINAAWEQAKSDSQEYQDLWVEYSLFMAPYIYHDSDWHRALACTGIIERLNELGRKIPGYQAVNLPLFRQYYEEDEEGEEDLMPPPLRGSATPLRHFKKALEYTMAMIPLGDKDKWVIERTKDCKTIVGVRSKLKEIKKTALNQYAPLLYKLATGNSPPMLDGQILAQAGALYNAICENSNRVREARQVVTWLSLDYLLEGDNRRLLDYIHLPQKARMIKTIEEYMPQLKVLNIVPTRYIK